MTTPTVPTNEDSFQTKACLNGTNVEVESADELAEIITAGGHTGSCSRDEMGLPIAPGEHGYVEAAPIVLSGTYHVTGLVEQPTPEPVTEVVALVEQPGIPMVAVPAPISLPETGGAEVVQSGVAGVLLVLGVVLVRFARTPRRARLGNRGGEFRSAPASHLDQEPRIERRWARNATRLADGPG